MFLQSAVRLVWLVDYLVRNSFYQGGKPTFISFQASLPTYRSKLQNGLKYTLNNLHANCTASTAMFVFVFVLFFLNPAAEIMLDILSNTLFKITPHNTQKKNKNKVKNKVWTDDIHDDTVLPRRSPATISTNFLSQSTLIPPIT